MRIKVTLEHPEEKEITFPLYYNHTLQGFIYHHLSSKLANFLHEEGYPLGKRKFKLFTFSRLLGNFRINSREEEITFLGPISFYLSAPSLLKKVLEECAESLLKSPDIYLSRNSLIVKSIEVCPPISPQSEVTIRMLSPVTVYSTLFFANGKKKTYYYSPFEKEFSQLIKANILKKYQALHKIFPGKKLDSPEFHISPLRVNKNSEKIIKYIPSSSSSYTLIKAWLGTYKIEGSPELISLAYDTGIGSKNSQGFGMFEIASNRI